MRASQTRRTFQNKQIPPPPLPSTTRGGRFCTQMRSHRAPSRKLRGRRAARPSNPRNAPARRKTPSAKIQTRASCLVAENRSTRVGVPSRFFNSRRGEIRARRSAAESGTLTDPGGHKFAKSPSFPSLPLRPSASPRPPSHSAPQRTRGASSPESFRRKGRREGLPFPSSLSLPGGRRGAQLGREWRCQC